MGRERGGLEGRDRAFAQELAYGTVRLRGRLDHLLDHHLRTGLSGVAPALLDVLRMGAYQLLRMGGVPDYAAVSEAVERGRAVEGRGAGGLVNAVLRAVARAGEDTALFPDPDADPAGWLSTWGSHPRWLVERWLARWPVEDVRALVERDNVVPPLGVVPMDGDAAAAVRWLAEAGLRAREAGFGSGAVEVTGADEGGVDPVAALAAVRGFVQDPAAALVTVYADIPEGALVADLCAAPGGKALALSRRAGLVLAADRSAARLRLLRDNVARTGGRVSPVVALAERPPVREADVVLLDVPCTGTGTLRRHPDARWRLTPDAPARMAEIQTRILAGAADAVSSGGLLVYSTCTLEPEENEAVVEAFLRSRPDYRLEPPVEGTVPPEVLDGVGRLAVLPWRTGFDGAFAARLRRIGKPRSRPA